MTDRPTPPRPHQTDPEHGEILLAVQQIGRDLREFRHTTSGTLERLLPMTIAVADSTLEIREALRRMDADLATLKRRVAALEQASHVHHPEGP